MLGPGLCLSYEQTVIDTRPVFYMPLQGRFPPGTTVDGTTEVVRGIPSRNQAAGAAASVVAGPGRNMRAAGMTNGSSQSIQVATDTSYHPGDTFSFMCWFNRTATGASSASLFHDGSGDFVVYFTSNQLTLRKAGTGDIYLISSPTFASFPTGWHCIVFTKNGSGAGNTCTAYLDGVLTSATYTNRTIAASSTAPGVGEGVGQSNTGVSARMAHVALWNRVLTFGEARELYAQALAA